MDLSSETLVGLGLLAGDGLSEEGFNELVQGVFGILMKRLREDAIYGSLRLSD